MDERRITVGGLEEISRTWRGGGRLFWHVSVRDRVDVDDNVQGTRTKVMDKVCFKYSPRHTGCFVNIQKAMSETQSDRTRV